MPVAPIASKVFSLTGVLPLGAFLALHLYVAQTALRGEQALADASLFVARLPAVRVLEVVVVLVPLALHAAYGLYLIALRKPHGPAHLYATRVRVLLRITGVVALAFIVWHLLTLRGVAPGETLSTALAANLSWTAGGIPVVALFYLLGVTSVVFHFAAGLWGALVTWGWLPSTRAKAVGRAACAVLGVVLGAAGVLPVVSLATGTRIFRSADFTEIELPPREVACPPGSAAAPPL